MIQPKIEDSGIVIEAYHNREPLPYNEWQNTDDFIYYQPLSILVDNGEAQVEGNKCFVPSESLYLLDSTEQMLLGVPSPYRYAMRLRGEGMLNTTSFSYNLEFLDHVPDGNLIPAERHGNILTTPYGAFLLSREQWGLAEAVTQYNAVASENKTTDFNLRQFANVKSLAHQAGCQLDSYLANENVMVPHQIHLEINREGDEFSILPSVDIEENRKFQSTFERQRKVLPVYPVQNDKGERTRVVLAPNQIEGLNTLKQRGCRYRNREDVEAIIQNPTEFFDPEQFDLSEFYSDRVIEIGVYKPKFYSFICPYKSQWIAGASVETPFSGTTRVTIKTEEELAQLNESIEVAQSQHEDLVEFKDTKMDLADAQFLADVARRQLDSPSRPVKSPQDKRVLIIEENAENLGYEAEGDDVTRQDSYTLFHNPRLDSGFQLKEHQKQGVAWLQHLYLNKASGALIADDMGLGKTLQVLYFLDWHSQKYPDHKPYLIVAPISLLENWEQEFKRFFPASSLQICRLTSKDVPRQFNREKIEEIQKMDIVVTNYDTLRISQMNICAVQYDVAILDEAQNVKTPGTLKTNAAKALKSKFKVAMTGTPVENTLVDLWCIMDYCVPGLLGNAKEFVRQYQSPLKTSDVDIETMGKELHDRLGFYFIRRMKSDVARDLPVKHEYKKQVEMPPVQQEMYQGVVKAYSFGQGLNMLQAIHGIRTVSEHPFLYDDSLDSRGSNELIDASARLSTTMQILSTIKAKDEKVIIFAERKESQKMLQRLIREKYGVVPKIINGDTPTSGNLRKGKESRQGSIDKFQSVEGFNVIIMSPIAAGMGLNVTAANHVIHFSRHWNPAKENQATDRAYRIGQTKDVYVYYPMAVSKNFRSFDLSLDELLERKRDLASSTIFPTERIEVNPEELGQMLFASALEK